MTDGVEILTLSLTVLQLNAILMILADTFVVLPMGGAGAQGLTAHVPHASTTVVSHLNQFCKICQLNLDNSQQGPGTPTRHFVHVSYQITLLINYKPFLSLFAKSLVLRCCVA